MFQKKLSILIALALVPLQVPAQTSEALPFVRIVHDASREAMAGAGSVSGASAAWASFDNAALCAYGEEKFDAAVGYQTWTPTEGSYLNAGASYMLTRHIGITAGASYGLGKPYDIYSATGAKTGTFTPSQFIANLGAGVRILPWLSTGANVHMASETLAAGQKHSTISGDVFVMAHKDKIKAALGVVSLGSAVYSASGDKFNIPTSAKLAAGYEDKLSDALSFGAYADLDYYIYSGGVNAAAGVRAEFMGMARLMAGYNLGTASAIIPSHASVGLGASIAGISLDAALLLGGTVNRGLIFNLGYKF